MAKVIKYTLDNGVTFSSASKVVSKKWTDGDVEGAFESYLTHKLIDPMAKAGMSKKLRDSWLRSIRAGIKTEGEGQTALQEYKNQVQNNVADNIKNQYVGVLNYLRQSGNEDVRRIVSKIESLIEEVSGWYHDGSADYLAREIGKILSSADDLTEEALAEMETATEYFVGVQKQQETTSKFKFQVKE